VPLRQRTVDTLLMKALTFLLATVLLGISGCTTVGVNTRERATIDFGPPVSLSVCVLRSPGITSQKVDELVAAVNMEFAPYGIQVIVPWQHAWTRAGFTHSSLFDDVARRDLEPPCDRLVALVDRNAGDFLWGLLLPEILGEVDEATHTRGYIVAMTGSVNQLFEPPSKGAVHEFYHLLGCPHAASLSKCYHLIATLKTHIDPAKGFVPGIAANGDFLFTRVEANAVMRSAVAYEDTRREGTTLDQAQVVKQIQACETNPATPADHDVRGGAAETSVPNKERTVVCLCVDEAGVLTQDPMIASSSGSSKMDEAANRLAKSASGQYRPAIVDGKPAAGCFQLAITFKAQKGPDVD
jgi:hypothetical protein